MPLLKHNPSAAPGPVVLDLTDLGRQAERLAGSRSGRGRGNPGGGPRGGGRAGGRGGGGGREAGFAEGRAEGFAAGEDAGREEARAAEAETLAAAAKLWEEAAAGVATTREGLAQEAESATLKLAVALAEKVVARHLDTHPEAAVDALRNALTHVLEPVAATARVHPDDLAAAEHATPGLAGTGGGAVRLVADEAVPRGGCVVEHGAGEIDARVETKLHRLAGLLLGDEEEPGEDAEPDLPPEEA